MSTLLRSTLLATLLLGAAACSSKLPLANEVAMKVTDKGFEPPNLRVSEGKPVVLTITRTDPDTCATEIVIDEYGVNTKLPLNEPVKVRFTPNKSGELKYGCAMQKMIGGVISVE